MKRRHLLALSASAAFWATILAYWYLAEASVMRTVRHLMKISDEDKPVFPGHLEDYQVSERLSFQSIEAASMVIDEQHTEPGVPFGYLNHQWRTFKDLVEYSRIRHGDDVEVVEYRIPRTNATLGKHLQAIGAEVKWPESVVYAARRHQRVIHTFWASGALQRDF